MTFYPQLPMVSAGRNLAYIFLTDHETFCIIYFFIFLIQKDTFLFL